MPITPQDIELASRGNPALKRALQAIAKSVTTTADKIGVSVAVQPVVSGVVSAAPPASAATGTSVTAPRPAAISVTGANGKFQVNVTNPLPDADTRAAMVRTEPDFQTETTLSTQAESRTNRKMNLVRQDDSRRNARIIHLIESSTAADFSANLSDYGPSDQTQFNIQDSGATRYWRIKSRFEDSDFSNWSVYANATGAVAVAAGLLPLDQTLDSSDRKAVTGATTSYRPLSNPLTATDNGLVPVVTINAFVMRVAGVGDVNIAGGSANGSAGDYGKTGFLYYDDTNMVGGAPQINMAFTRETALSGAARFFIGSINLPKSGYGDTVGNNDGGTGGQYSRQWSLLPTAYSAAGWANPQYGIDDNTNTYSSATTAGANLVYIASGFGAYYGAFSALVLQVITQITSIAGTSTAVVDYSLDAGANWTTLRSVSSADVAPVTTTATLQTTTRTENVQVRVTLPGSTSSSSSSLYAGTGVNDGSIGITPWTSPSNITGAPDSNPATVAITATPSDDIIESTMYAAALGYGFAIPGGATISGIVVTVTRRATKNTTAPGYILSCTDASVRLYKGGGLSGADRSAGASWPTSFTAATFGSSSDLWGLTWTPADINASTWFGVGVAANMEADGTAAVSGHGTITAGIDAIQITVYYTTGGASAATGRLYSATQTVSL